MTHAELVQAATNLIAEVGQSDFWLERYDAALTSSTDRELGELVYQLAARMHAPMALAA